MEEVTDKDTVDYLNFLYQKSSDIRGRIIDHSIHVEMSLSNLLAEYFCSDNKKVGLCLSIVFNSGDLTFSSKVKILKTILDTAERELGIFYPKLIDNLESIRKTRNRVAHSKLDTSESFLKHKHTDRIQLKFYGEGETKQMTISDLCNLRPQRQIGKWNFISD